MFKIELKDAVAARFLEICNQRGLAINGLATLSGVTPSTVYSLMDERRRHVSIRTIKILCDGLDMTLSDFFASELFTSLPPEIK